MDFINRLGVPSLGGEGGKPLQVPRRGGGEGGSDVAGTVFIIVGPTASGKTTLSLQLARYFNTAIISADSRQCFRELGVAVAKPTEAELQAVKHYFINSHSINDVVNAQVFEDYALQAVNEIFHYNKYAVMVGGTGLYVKAFCEGLDEIPDVEDKIREDVISLHKTKGLAWLQQQVQAADPDFWAVGETQNPQRLMRALEVKLATGRSILSFRKRQPVERPFNIVKIGIAPPKDILHGNINSRVDSMMQSGLLEEARNMLPYRSINALQTVGYKELFNFFDGNCTLQQAVEQIKLNTRHYAKRQMTWFKKDTAINWQPNASADFIAHIYNKGGN